MNSRTKTIFSNIKNKTGQRYSFGYAFNLYNTSNTFFKRLLN